VDVITDLNKALERLKAFLEEHYFPACRVTWGVSGWPDGQEVYAACLRYHTSTNMTPFQVHDLGLREVARIRANMYDVSKQCMKLKNHFLFVSVF
jgi:uncharacterized protein (DUF885 family)